MCVCVFLISAKQTSCSGGNTNLCYFFRSLFLPTGQIFFLFFFLKRMYCYESNTQQVHSSDVKVRRPHTHILFDNFSIDYVFLLFLSVIGHDRCPLPPTLEKQMPERIKASSALTSCSPLPHTSSTLLSLHTFLGLRGQYQFSVHLLSNLLN